MGEGGKDALGVGFDGSLRLEFHGSTVTSDAGLIPYRQLDEALGTTAMAGSVLQDQRTGRNTRHTMTALLRQSVYSRLTGYEDMNDADRLCVDPTMRCIVGGRAGDSRAASTSQMGRFETQVLTRPDNLAALMAYNQRGTAEQWIKEGKHALNWTRLSCGGFADNQVRLQRFALAYNLANFLRRLALPKGVEHWTLTTLRDRLIKIGAKVVRHARRVTFQMAEVAVPGRLFTAILQRIGRLRVSPNPAGSG